ncbi:MAG: hypothetical protein JNJ63_12200 [Hyphomonadaceae bacterium]|nr:hypothetical protein [Hyphomonadaceae bacterium]
MAGLTEQLKRAEASLRAFVDGVESDLKHGRALDSERCHVLQNLAGGCETLLIRTGGAPSAHRTLQRACVLIEQCDPLACLRAAKLDYIDCVATACDRLMSAGQMPARPYLDALGAAVCDYETMHSLGDDDHHVAFAWDILAQAEAGAGEAAEDVHYEAAEQRYRRPAAVNLTLVTRAAG